MPAQILVKKVKANSSGYFQFSSNVTSYVVGMSELNIAYPEKDHHVASLSINITSNHPSPDVVTVHAHCMLVDESGNFISALDVDQCTVTVSILAWVSTPADNLILVNQTGIMNERTGEPIPLPVGVINAYSILSGFYFSYENAVDHHLQTLKAKTIVNRSGEVASIIANGDMHDGSNHSANYSSFDGGLIAYADENLGLVFQKELFHNGVNTTTLSRNIASWAIFISGLQVRWAKSQDHHLRRLKCDFSSISYDSATKKLSTTLEFIMSDSSSSATDNAFTELECLIVGVAA